MNTPPNFASNYALLLGIAGSFLLVAGIMALMIHFGLQDKLHELLRWFDAQGIWAPVLFILLMAAAVVFVLPGIVLTTGAGFVFGVIEGTIVVVLGTTMGAAISFLIARYLFGPRFAKFVLRNAKLTILRDEMLPHSGKIVLLTRLIPFFPSKLANYFFGLSGFSFFGYLTGSLIGFIPYSLNSVYVGSIAANISALGEHQAMTSPLGWFVYGGGFVASIFAALYLSRLSNKALSEYARNANAESETQQEEHRK